MTSPGFTNREHPPTTSVIIDAIGWPDMWLDLQSFIETVHLPDKALAFDGIRQCWAIRYHRERQLLCALYPDCGTFAVLITLHPDEAQRAWQMRGTFHKTVRQLLPDTAPLHTGLELWLPVNGSEEVLDIKRLLDLKQPLAQADQLAA